MVPATFIPRWLLIPSVVIPAGFNVSPHRQRGIMVDQLPLNANARPTLDEVWSGLAARTSPRVAILLAGSGLGAAAWSRSADLPWMLTLATMIVAAFGSDALLRANQLGDGRPEKRTIRVASALTRAVAALSAAAIGLLLLGIIFGGKIEVMRR